MRIALDVMGTDQRPVPDIQGGVMAAREYGDTILLVGDEARIRPVLSQEATQGLSLEVVHAPEEIAMNDKPSDITRGKQQSSMHKGMRLVKEGEADAFVTMGNTGAAYAVATLATLGRIPGVKRPALTTIFPLRDKQVIILDMGANSDAKAEWLVQFAVMGDLYAQAALKLQRPRIATLSNGEEEGKGTAVLREVQALMSALPLNYQGHIEPFEITQDKADVIVTDGFVGNIFLKTFEGTVRYFAELLRGELTADWMSKLGAWLARDAFGRVRQSLNPDLFGGAPLIGVNGVVVIGHGGNGPLGVKSSINQARLAVLGDTVTRIREGLEQLALDAKASPEGHAQ